MVKVLNPLGGTEAHGTMSGVTYRTHGSAQVVHRRGVPPFQHNERQRQTNTFLLAAATAWRALSGADRNAWRAQPQPHGTGFSTFCRYKLNMLLLGSVLDPPLLAPPISVVLPNFEAIVSPGDDDWAITWSVDTPDFDLLVAFYVAPRQSIAQAGDSHRKVFLTGADYTDTSITLYKSNFVNKLPVFFIRFVYSATGRTGTWWKLPVDIRI